MPKYNTVKRKILLDYFDSHADQNISALEIVDELTKKDISKSAIYRNLAELEEEQRIERVSKQNEKITYYRYVDSTKCKDKIHLFCLKCGKTIHLSQEVTQYLDNQLYQLDGFKIDNNKSNIYGLCSRCQ